MDRGLSREEKRDINLENKGKFCAKVSKFVKGSVVLQKSSCQIVSPPAGLPTRCKASENVKDYHLIIPICARTDRVHLHCKNKKEKEVEAEVEEEKKLNKSRSKCARVTTAMREM